MIDDLVEKQWIKLKTSLPIGLKFIGTVIMVKPFGVFVDVGFEIIDGYKLSGIIDVITKDDHDSSGLPLDYNLWPSIGERIHCKVLHYRDSIKEVSLGIVNEPKM
jgi:ribosomal protein S1